MTVGQITRLVLVVLVLCSTIWLGLKDGLASLFDAESTGQRVAAAFQISYGLAAIACLVSLFGRPAWARPAFVAWAAALTVTAGLAPVVWGGSPWRTGVLSGGGTLVIAGIVAWGGLAHLRTKAVP